MLAKPALPVLREDLRLYESGADQNGAPVWAIQDPVINRFYRIGWVEYECLLRWPGNPEQIAATISQETPLAVTAETVQDFASFLEQHNLTRPTEQSMQRMLKAANEPGWRAGRWWLHNYLFFRLPIIKPQRFLQAFLPVVRLLFSWWALAILLVLTAMGLVLVARQWDVFTHDVVQMFTPEGLLGFAFALIVSKMLHELGHAFVATHYGVRVAHMGVAFLVMWPMLYTDTGESWRLKSHKQRLAISIAGVSTELALAGLATLLWAVLGDGALRQSMLYLATTGWVLSLALNVSPFMRFDGYFILSDIMNFPNLHERAGRAARTWVRRTLLGWDEPYAESFSDRKRRFLVVFALMTWLYRLIVFLGIAVAVYVFFFKLLGIFLMAVEVAWFIVRPIWSEVSVWLKRRNEISSKKRVFLILALLALAVLLTFPWPFRVKGYGIARPERVQYVYTPFPAQVQSVIAPGSVAKDTVLATFIAPEYSARAARNQASVQALNQHIGGLAGDQKGLAQDMRLRRELQEHLAESLAVQEESGRLNIQSEFAGIWLDVDPLLKKGVWLNTHDTVGVLLDPSSWIIDAYIEQRQIQRIKPGVAAVFYPDNRSQVFNAKLLAVDTVNTRQLPYPQLAAKHGGHLATLPHEQRLIPSQALYRVRLELTDPPASLQEMRGTVRITGEPKSLLLGGAKDFIAVLVRESGF